jgi:transglutaminase-like putative cysteine protease
MPRPERRAELSLDELHQLRWLLGGVLTLVALATVLYMDVSSPLLLGFTAAASLAATLWPALPGAIPRRLHVLAFPLIAAAFAADLWLRSELLPAMVRLDLALLLYRAVVYRQKRDDLQLIVLGLFLVIVAGVLTVSMAFAAHILVYSGTALLFLLVLTLIDSANSRGVAAAQPSAVPAAPTPAVPSWAANVSWRRVLSRAFAVCDWRVLSLAAGLFVGLIAGSALLFLLIPRFELDNGMFLDRFITKKARSGFSDTIRFGDVTEIQQDTSIALHFDADPGQVPLAPYWRMMVLDEYENGVFRMSPALRARAFGRDLRTDATYWAPLPPHPGHGSIRVYLEPGISRHLPLLGPFRVLRFAEVQTYRPPSETGLLALSRDPVTMTAFQVDGYDLSSGYRDAPLETMQHPFPPRGQTWSAASDEKTLAGLVRSATGTAPLSAAEFAEKVGAWLREHHAYSLTPRIPGGAGDPLVRWAASEGPGHCELFAGTFVLLARSAGFPARVVTGFRGGAWNPFSSSFTVRNSDAHAWAEIYDPKARRWLRADPLEVQTASTANEPAADTATARKVDRGWSARVDSLRVFWYRRVVSFDEQSQVHTLRSAKELAQQGVERLRLRISRLALVTKLWLRSPWDVGRVGRLAGVLLAAVALTWAWRRARRFLLRLNWGRRRARRSDPIRREAGRWLQRLRPETMAATTPAEAPPVIADLQRLRYGPRESWPEPAKVFRQARRAAKTAPR